MDENHIWVFGYGSLIWRPNFTYADRVTGYVNGFERKFWQGSTYHRGTAERPGRVVTLVEKSNSRVWGVAYRIQGKENIRKALGHLTTREQSLGCYGTQMLTFHSTNQHHNNNSSSSNNTISVLVYYASPQNDCYRGYASDVEISSEIFLSSGVCGSNIEYLFRLADFMREEVPCEKDEHLYVLENLVRLRLGLSTKNIVSWLELIKCNQFLYKLRLLSEENSENLVTV
eukprot:Seg1972.11 transcript_id=Seg1972.11/GoldUCD/mRNA.D3Y31 product="Glutathione-specific gamma-glutamylcyclotransferase 1" protein_id=Seg1972.11/GoldUCD/D3Y31